jgi:branched-subunit amino acid ABC-type transport system permease component
LSADILLQLIIIGLTNGVVIALNALGLTLIYGHTRALNLAHGDVFALTTVCVTSLVPALWDWACRGRSYSWGY